MRQKLLLITSLSAAAILLAGCLISGTFVVVIGLNHMYSQSDLIAAEWVDLTEEQIWEDHKDDVKNVSDVRFRAHVESQTAIEATGQVYFSRYDHFERAGQLDSTSTDSAFIVFADMSIPPPPGRVVTFVESAGYIRNLELAKPLIESGQFYIYVVASEKNFDIEAKDISVMITLDAGP